MSNILDEIKSDLQSLRDLVIELKNDRKGKVNDDDEKLLSPEEACKMWVPAISKPTLRDWSNKGLLPFIRMGSRVFYRKSEVLAALDSLKRYSRH